MNSSSFHRRLPCAERLKIGASFRWPAMLLLLSMLASLPGSAVWKAQAADESATQIIVAFDAANKLYEQGGFDAAARGYQQLIDGGQRSVTLYFNLGNAWFKAGQVGRSIAAYRQAERLAPREPNVQFNLAFARKRVSSGEPPAGLWLDRILGGLTLDEWTWLTTAALWLALLFLAAGECRESFRPTARRYAVLLAVIAFVLGAGTAGAAQRWRHPSDAVIVVSDAIVRSGPLEEGKMLHQFRDGTEVKILDLKKLAGAGKAQTWYFVRNSAAQTGWVKVEQLALIH